MSSNIRYLKKKKRRKKKHPIKYLKYKGCFGNPRHLRCESPEEIDFGTYLSVFNEPVFEKMRNDMEDALENPDKILDMSKINRIDICGGLVLKAFFDEYKSRHNKKPRIKAPQIIKTRVIFNYLKIKNYMDVKNIHEKDVDCWQILSWDESESKEIHFPKLIREQVIPKGWRGKHSLSEDSSDVAGHISEAFYNCIEHAYTGKKESEKFKRWYFGVGDYMESKRYTFLVYDKGIGIKTRLMDNSDGWLTKASDWTKSDYEMIELATKGMRGASEGRGKGLSSAINELQKNDGEIDIISGYGYFSTDKERGGKNRKPYLQGTLVAFSFPVKYSEDV